MKIEAEINENSLKCRKTEALILANSHNNQHELNRGRFFERSKGTIGRSLESGTTFRDMNIPNLQVLSVQGSPRQSVGGRSSKLVFKKYKRHALTTW